MSTAPAIASPQEINIYVRRTFDAANREARRSFAGETLYIELPGDFPDGMTHESLQAEFSLLNIRQPSLNVQFEQLTLDADPKAIFKVRQR